MRSFPIWVIAFWFVEGLLARPVAAQQATLRWLQPSLDLGQTVEVELTIDAPARYRFFLTDTVLAFAPFEYLGVSRRDSTILGNTLRRSTHFRVRSFQIEERQSLRLVLFYHNGTDSARTLTLSTTPIVFQPRITGDPDQQVFGFNPERIPIPEPVDLTRVWWWVAGTGAAIIAGGLLLRRPLRRWWLRHRLARYGRRLRNELLAVRELSANSAAFIQQLNRVWKEDLQHAWPVSGLRWKSCTSDELPQALRHHSTLSDDAINLLTELCQKEDRIFYGRAKADEGELLRLWNYVDTYLQGELRRRRQAIS